MKLPFQVVRVWSLRYWQTQGCEMLMENWPYSGGQEEGMWG